MAKDQDKKKDLLEEEENTSKKASEEKEETEDKETEESEEEEASEDKADSTEDSASEDDNEDSKEDEDADSEPKKKNITPEATFDSPNGKSVHRPIVYVELALAIIALVFIIVAILNYRKTHNPQTDPTTGTDPSVVTTDITGSALPDGAQTAEIDNSKVAEMKPATPDVTAMNDLTEADCEAKVADGTMIRMDCTDGTYVYVSNFKDQDYLASQLVVTDADVDKMIKEEFLDVEKVPMPCDHDVAELGDIANIDYVGKKDGVAFDGTAV